MKGFLEAYVQSAASGVWRKIKDEIAFFKSRYQKQIGEFVDDLTRKDSNDAGEETPLEFLRRKVGTEERRQKLTSDDIEELLDLIEAKDVAAKSAIAEAVTLSFSPEERDMLISECQKMIDAGDSSLGGNWIPPDRDSDAMEKELKYLREKERPRLSKRIGELGIELSDAKKHCSMTSKYYGLYRLAGEITGLGPLNSSGGSTTTSGTTSNNDPGTTSNNDQRTTLQDTNYQQKPPAIAPLFSELAPLYRQAIFLNEGSGGNSKTGSKEVVPETAFLLFMKYLDQRDQLQNLVRKTSHKINEERYREAKLGRGNTAAVCSVTTGTINVASLRPDYKGTKRMGEMCAKYTDHQTVEKRSKHEFLKDIGEIPMIHVALRTEDKGSAHEEEDVMIK